MKKVLILVEGQTEEGFVKRVLNEHLRYNDIYLVPTIIATKRVKQGSDFKGGVISYVKVRKEILKLLGDTTAKVTTMFDFYGLPNDFAGRFGVTGRPHDKVSQVENSFDKDINNPRFFSYFSLHEFEGLLFSSPPVIARTMNESGKETAFSRIKNSFPTPEDINDNPETTPSKRISKECPQYDKVIHGSIIANRIGLETLRRECPHFDTWLNRIEQL